MHQRNRAALEGLGRHVADHHAPGAAAEAAVGDQAYALAQALANERASGGQHFRHARATLGAEVTQHHHVAGLDLAVHDGGQGALFVVEHTRGAGDHGVLQARDLGHAAFGAQVALEDGQVALGIDGLADRQDHVLARVQIGYVGQVLGHRLAGDGHAVTMQQPVLEHFLHQGGDAASTVQVDGQVLAAGLEVAQHRDLLAHAFVVVDRPVDARAMGDGQVVQDGVGGPTGGHDHRHGVLDRFLGDDVLGLEVLLDRFDQDGRSLLDAVHHLVFHIGHGGRVGQ